MAKEPRGTILVVDDTEATRYLVTRALRNSGYRVLEAVTGQEALSMAQEKPDLITLDIQLPDMSGLEVCKRIKASAETAAIPILHLSATFIHDQDKAVGLDGGADGYLTHPVEERVLSATVTSLLRARSAEGELRTAHAQLERQVLELREERELREKFVSTLTHDLRNPLSAAKLNAELIVRSVGSAETNKRLATRLVHNIERMDKMIKDLLDANSIRAGLKLPIEVGECDLAGLAKETIEGLTDLYGDRFKLSAKGVLPGFWSCDHLRRVIENLSSNAIKYGDPEASIQVLIDQKVEEIELSIHNMGNPLTQDEQSGLFEPFHRTTSALRGKQLGWGLGLTLVRGVAEAHGGRVRVESSLERGTTFTLTLPQDARPFQDQ